MGCSSPEEVNNQTAKEGHEILPVPSEASEFLRLIARILRRRTGKQEVAGGQSQNPDIEDTPEEDQG